MSKRQERLFRLTRQAHLNIVRNWLGQDTRADAAR